jgi:hypothetical protein
MQNPSRDGPPATANGIEEASAITYACPRRSRCARRSGR